MSDEPQPREYTCNPCRKGDHVDHHGGVWRRADGSDPAVCVCVRCNPAGASQLSLLEASA